jgi:4-amino-4-deoxy-L-arabinose transferase-like glycosyltransferase
LLGFLLVVFYFEVNVTLNGPIAFGDEGYWTSNAKWMSSNLEYPIYDPLSGSLIQYEGFNNPPMFPFLEASLFYLFGFSETIVKFLLPMLSFFLGLTVFLLLKRIFNHEIAFLAAVITITIPAVVTYSVLFYVDIFMLCWVMLSMGFFFLAIKEENRKYFLFSAVFTSFAILTKKPAAILLVFYGAYFLYEILQKKNFLTVLKKYLPYGIIVALILTPFAIRSYVYYKTPLCGLPYVFSSENCIKRIEYTNKEDFIQRTANTGTDVDVYQFGLVNYFQFAYGLLWFVPLVFIVGIVLLALRREKFDVAILIFLMISLAAFLYLYSGRTEDTSRYTLFAIPLIAVICAIYLTKITEVLKKHFKYFGICFIILILAVSYYNFSTKIFVMPQVKQFSPLFLDACKWAKQNLPSNTIMLSLYTAPTSYNCDRKAVWELPDLPDIVLSNNLNLTVNRLEANGISYVFVQKFSLSQQNYRISYPVSFVAFLESNPQTFKKVFENGPDYNTCLQSGGCDGTAIYKVIG